MLPFKTSDKISEEYLIEDGYGNSLPIPKYGCLTVDEGLATASVRYDPVKMSVADWKLNVVTAFLKSRFRLKELTPEEVAQQAQTQPMLDRIFDFYQNEQTRWQPSKLLLTALGEAAKSVSKNAAKTLNGVAAQDERFKDTWYVFASLNDVPEGYIYSDEDVHCPKDIAPEDKGGKG
jgi:hypothetical protein